MNKNFHRLMIAYGFIRGLVTFSVSFTLYLPLEKVKNKLNIQLISSTEKEKPQIV